MKLFEDHIRHGELTIVEADGSRTQYGEGEPKATWIIRKPGTIREILTNPAMHLGETYINQGWDAADGKLAELLTILRSNVEREVSRRSLLGVWAEILKSWNHVHASLRNVSHHYDLDATLFRTFLDRNMHYSCAYYRDRDASLESAQLAKCNHIARKLLLEPGHRVLDIGSGWGSLAMHLAEHHDVHVTGLTLSVEQLKAAREEASRRGLSDRVEFRLEDYRAHYGRYDRVVSVGMFEHVGRANFRKYFERVYDFLREGGVALLHTIGSGGRPGQTNPWIRRHVFPGGYIPALSEIVPAVERSSLTVCDVEVWRQHYAFTLKEWNRRFQARRAEIAATKGERFSRMWEFYLVASQTSFELGRINVFQVQLQRGTSPIPLTRDYLYRDESADVSDVSPYVARREESRGS
jgi:cyclopropane-fatty-acyl-phospholipid synthase